MFETSTYCLYRTVPLISRQKGWKQNERAV
jgi:hypothetical protein